ncbi:MAG: c-type cytochrome [Methylotenera sp.]
MIVSAETNSASASTTDQETKIQVNPHEAKKLRQVHVRSLAASCAACHGTNGNSVGKAANLAGMDSAYFLKQMQAFKSGERSATVMNRHAKGLNIQEITDLSEYFSLQIPKASVQLIPQKLSVKHAN